MRRLTAGDSCENVADSIKEEKLRCHGCLDEHRHTSGNHCEESDDVHHTDSIEDNVSRACQRLPRERHLGCAS